LFKIYSFKCKKKTLEKTESAIKNGQSREAGNIGYARHRTNTSKAQYRKLKRTTRIPSNTGEKSCDREGQAAPAFYKTPAMLLI